MDIVSDRSSLAASLGTPGGSFPATLKDLGISRLQAQQTGFSMFTAFANTLQTSISPTPNFARGDELLPFTSLTAGQRVQGELQAQQQAQEAEFIRSLENPAAAELFNQDFLAQQTAASIRAGTRPATTSVAAGAVSGAASGAQGVLAAG